MKKSWQFCEYTADLPHMNKNSAQSKIDFSPRPNHGKTKRKTLRSWMHQLKGGIKIQYTCLDTFRGKVFWFGDFLFQNRKCWKRWKLEYFMYWIFLFQRLRRPCLMKFRFHLHIIYCLSLRNIQTCPNHYNVFNLFYFMHIFPLHSLQYFNY